MDLQTVPESDVDDDGRFVETSVVTLTVTSHYIANPAEARQMEEWFKGGWPLPSGFIAALDYGVVEGTTT